MCRIRIILDERRIKGLLVAFFFATMLQGCFTGVESTPKIKDSEIKRQHVVVTDEERLLANVQPEPFAHWKPGKLFYVTDNKISLIFTPASYGGENLAFKTIAFKGCESVTSVTGEETSQLEFTDLDGAKLFYRINASPDKLRQRDRVEIPFTIEQSLVDATDSLITGRTLFVTTSRWLDPATLNPIANMRRHIPVKVVDVQPGNDVYPLKVVFRPLEGNRADSVSDVAVLITTDRQRAHSRGFQSVFSLSDPQLRYPRITRETWESIRNSQVTDGMTRDECRLALGAPANITKNNNNAGAFERWIYENGSYLIFQDNILIKYRQ